MERASKRVGDDGPLGSVDPGDATTRQAQVLQLAAAGFVAKEIMRSLGILIRTVDVHVGVMRQHAETRNKAELLAGDAARGLAHYQPPSGRPGAAGDGT